MPVPGVGVWRSDRVEDQVGSQGNADTEADGAPVTRRRAASSARFAVIHRRTEDSDAISPRSADRRALIVETGPVVLELRDDVVSVRLDRRRRHLPQPGIGKPRGPPRDPLCPDQLTGRWGARRQPLGQRRGQELPHRLPVQIQALADPHLRPPGLPMHEQLGQIHHVQSPTAHHRSRPGHQAAGGQRASQPVSGRHQADLQAMALLHRAGRDDSGRLRDLEDGQTKHVSRTGSPRVARTSRRLGTWARATGRPCRATTVHRDDR